MVNGNPAISYYDATNGDLRYVRASDASGTGWGAPVTLDSSSTVGQHTSLALVNGNPAISYFDVTNGVLKYVRAVNASGTSWGALLTFDSTSRVGEYTSLAVVNGSPAISYFDNTSKDLKFVSRPELVWQASDGTVAPLTAASVATGAIGSTQLATGVVDNAKIATGAEIDAAKLGTGLVSTGEFNFLDGVTSNIQTQLNGKLSLNGGTVTGPLTANSYKLSPAKTGVLQITGNGFVVDNPADNYDRGAGLISPAGGDTFLQFLADVHLPDGATVTKLVGVFADLGAENFTNIDLRLRYFSTSSLSVVTMAEILAANTVGISSGRVEFEDSTVANNVINNTDRAYTVDIAMTVDSATANTRFYGVRIEYTYDTLAP